MKRSVFWRRREGRGKARAREVIPDEIRAGILGNVLVPGMTVKEAGQHGKLNS